MVAFGGAGARGRRVRRAAADRRAPEGPRRARPPGVSGPRRARCCAASPRSSGSPTRTRPRCCCRPRTCGCSRRHRRRACAARSARLASSRRCCRSLLAALYYARALRLGPLELAWRGARPASASLDRRPPCVAARAVGLPAPARPVRAARARAASAADASPSRCARAARRATPGRGRSAARSRRCGDDVTLSRRAAHLRAFSTVADRRRRAAARRRRGDAAVAGAGLRGLREHPAEPARRRLVELEARAARAGRAAGARAHRGPGPAAGLPRAGARPPRPSPATRSAGSRSRRSGLRRLRAGHRGRRPAQRPGPLPRHAAAGRARHGRDRRPPHDLRRAVPRAWTSSSAATRSR